MQPIPTYVSDIMQPHKNIVIQISRHIANIIFNYIKAHHYIICIYAVSRQLMLFVTQHEKTRLMYTKYTRDATILQYNDILQYSLLQYNTIHLMKNINILHIATFFAFQVVRIELLH